MLDHQNNYVGLKPIVRMSKLFAINVLYNYFDGLALFSDLYLAKLLNTSAKLFFPWKMFYMYWKLLRFQNKNKENS